MKEPTRPLWPVFLVTSLGAFLVSLDLSIVNVAFPALTRAFPEASRADLSWIVTALVKWILPPMSISLTE